MHNLRITRKSCIDNAVEFGVDIGWAITERRKYLLKEIEKLAEVKRQMQANADRANQSINALARGGAAAQQFIRHHENYFSQIRKLGEVREQLSEHNDMLYQLNGYENSLGARVSREDIERCRQYPYYKLLGLEKDNTMIKCPFHQDTNPSFLVRGVFGYCFGCGAREDSIEAMMRQWGLNFTQAIQELQKRLRITTTEGD